MNKKINILYITRSLELAGAERMVCDLASNLDPDKFKVTVCTFVKGSLMEEMIKRGIEVILMERKFRYDPTLVWRIARLISGKKINIIHSHMFQSSLYALPLVLLFKKLVFVISEHGGHLEISRITRRRCFYEIIAKVSKAVIVVSSALKDELSKIFRIPPEKIVVIYNGIEITKFDDNFDSLQTKRKIGLKLDTLVIGNVANLNPPKGHKYLLEAMPIVLHEIQNTKLIIIGDGALRSELENQTEKLRISENVIFLGRRNDIPELLSIMDVFVMPSITSGETFCIAAAEAMAMGKPVVASRIGGLPEVVADTKTGFLVPPKNPAALAAAIIKLLKDRKLALDMGQAGKKRVGQEFTLDKMVKRTEQLYENLVKAYSVK